MVGGREGAIAPVLRPSNPKTQVIVSLGVLGGSWGGLSRGLFEFSQFFLPLLLFLFLPFRFLFALLFQALGF